MLDPTPEIIPAPPDSAQPKLIPTIDLASHPTKPTRAKVRMTDGSSRYAWLIDSGPYSVAIPDDLSTLDPAKVSITPESDEKYLIQIGSHAADHSDEAVLQFPWPRDPAHPTIKESQTLVKLIGLTSIPNETQLTNLALQVIQSLTPFAGEQVKPKEKSPFTIAAATYIGTRTENQDRFRLCDPEQLSPETLARGGYLYLIADGMGGVDNGSQAAEAASQTFYQEYYDQIRKGTNPTRSLELAGMAAHKRVLETNGSSTLDTCVIIPGDNGQSTLHTFHIGDSRIQLYSNHQFEQLTKDQTMAYRLYEIGAINLEEVETHPRRNFIYSSLGGDKYDPIIESKILPAHSDWTLILHTDGANSLFRKPSDSLLTRGPQDLVSRAVVMNIESSPKNKSDNATLLRISSQS